MLGCAAMFYAGRKSDVLALPIMAGFDLSSATTRERVEVRSTVLLSLLDETLVDECIEVWIETTVVDFCLIVVFEFLLDGETMWLIEACDHVQQVSLETCDVVHCQTYVEVTDICGFWYFSHQDNSSW